MEYTFPAGVLVCPSSEIHVFGDASVSAFGAVLYVVIPPGEDCPSGEVSLVKCKGKLCPPLKLQKSKEDSIPRWELCSMLIAGQLVQFVMKDVDELSHCPIYM